MDIFSQVKNVKENQWHAKFKLLKEDPLQDGERNILNEWVEGLVDRDHNMIEKFQKTFHSSFWEFYLYACFKKLGFSMDQTHNRPDFMITAPIKMNVEAVVSNIKNMGRPESTRNLEDLMDAFVPPIEQEDFVEVQREAVIRQSNAINTKANKYMKEYSKIQWVDEDVPFVIALSSYSQVNYGREYIYPMMTLLYGMEYCPVSDDYRNIEYIIKPETNAQIKVGLFNTEQYKHVSAVLYSCSTTLGKLTALSKSEGNFCIDTVWEIRRDYEDISIPYKLQEVNSINPELLTDGLFVFHNPNAAHKLNPSIFKNTNIVQYFFENGKIIHNSKEPHLVCRLKYPYMLNSAFQILIQEYIRQYNRINPIEFYSIMPYRKIKVDFEKECLVCIWIEAQEFLGLGNLHYKRNNILKDDFLEKEAEYEVKRLENYKSPIHGNIRRIDIIRSELQFEMINKSNVVKCK